VPHAQHHVPILVDSVAQTDMIVRRVQKVGVAEARVGDAAGEADVLSAAVTRAPWPRGTRSICKLRLTGEQGVVSIVPMRR
jgi:hypothetical protein